MPSPLRTPGWWNNAVVYQVYPRSFQDSDGDGIGDIPGVTSRLDHLALLGVDVLWLSPVYRSPMDDNGYEISDYEDVDPLSDAYQLVTQASESPIANVCDPNYTVVAKVRESYLPRHDAYAGAHQRQKEMSAAYRV